MNDDQLLRYSRHILLDDIGIDGQQRLLAARVLIIGVGGLGSPALLYLASAGVGQITLVDPDAVDLTNLQRQIAHRTSSVGRAKVDSARERIHELNPDVKVETVATRADAALLDSLVARCDLVLDCSDNFPTRQAVNAACVRHGRALVSGSAIGFDGQVSVFHAAAGGPCYACLFPADQAVEEVACASMGVFAPLVGIVGSVQAAEALKHLLGAGHGLAGRLLMLDARRMEWDSLTVKRRQGCPVCGSGTRASPGSGSGPEQDDGAV